MGMAAILIYGRQPFIHIFNPPLTQGSTKSLKKFGPGVSEEKSFRVVNGRMDDGRRVITIAHPEPLVHLYHISSKYSKGYSCYRVDKKSNSSTRRGYNSKSKKAKVVILVPDMSSSPVLQFYQVS